MIWCLIFLLLPSGGIGDHHVFKSAGDVFVTVPPYVLENDDFTINCSHKIAINASDYLKLARQRPTTRYIAETYNNASAYIYDHDFMVLAGSNGRAMKVVARAKCKHSNSYFCSLIPYSHMIYGPFDLRVLKKMTKPNLTIPDCWDDWSTRGCLACKSKQIDIPCKANVTFVSGSRIAFEWYYKNNSANCWTRIRNGISFARESAPWSDVWIRMCHPLKEKTSVLSVHLSTWRDLVHIKCEVHFTVGNFHYSTSSVTKLCISDQIYMQAPRKIFENDTVTISCSHTFAKNSMGYIGIWTSEKEGSQHSLAVAAAGYYPGSSDRKHDLSSFRVSQHKASIELYAESISWCNLSSWYHCNYVTQDAQNLVADTFREKLEVIHKITAIQLIVLNDVCLAADHKFRNECQICDNVIILHKKEIVVDCRAEISGAKGSDYRIEWYLIRKSTKIEGLLAIPGSWSQIKSKMYSVHGNNTQYNFTTGSCPPLKQINSRLHLPYNDSLNGSLAVKCVVTFTVASLSDIANATSKICIADDSNIGASYYPPRFKKNGVVLGIVLPVVLLCGIVGVVIFKARKELLPNQDNVNGRKKIPKFNKKQRANNESSLGRNDHSLTHTDHSLDRNDSNE